MPERSLRASAAKFLYLSAIACLPSAGSRSPYGTSHPPGILKLDQELIRIELPSVEDRPHVVVVDHEEIADRSKGPAQARVRSERLVLAVVLHVAREREIR